jgi:hypothetical protein
MLKERNFTYFFYCGFVVRKKNLIEVVNQFFLQTKHQKSFQYKVNFLLFFGFLMCAGKIGFSN